MSNPTKGARLYLNKSRGVFVIRDTGGVFLSTGTGSRPEAEAKLAAYIATKGAVRGTRTPEQMPVAEVLALYAQEHAPGVAAPERQGHAIDALLGFWGALHVVDVKGETCRRYGKSRFSRRGKAEGVPVAPATIRRELNVLQAAINHAHKEGYITSPVRVTLPEHSPSKDRWLTRSEAARLVWAAYRSSRSAYLARFILLSLYTGTRKQAVLNLGFVPSVSHGWIDLKQGVMYRRGAGERETSKRRKPVKLTPRLLAHCERWKRKGARYAVESEDGQRIGDVKTAFRYATRNAKLSGVSPHTLKHTAITWAIQRGMKAEDAADYFDTSVQTIYRTYYHHSPSYQKDAVEVLGRR